MKKIFFRCVLGFTIFFSQLSFAVNNVVSFATEATYPPFEFLDNKGQMQGFDIDIIKAICQKMQVQCKFTNQAFDSLIPSLQLGKFDAVFGAMDITPERQKQVDFTQPYYVNTASIVVPKAESSTLKPDNLQGKTIGVQAGTTMQSYLQKKYGNSVKVNTYASEQAAFLDLTTGRIDAVMGDTPLIVKWLQQHTKDYMLIGEPIRDENYFGKGYGIAVRKGNQELLNKLNAAIEAIKNDGTQQRLINQYFSFKTPDILVKL
jgi:arginine transport system substrate-binding protein